MNTSDTETKKGITLGGIIANIFVGSLTLICLAIFAISSYFLAITATSYIKAGGYSTWVETPAVLKRAANPTEDRPYDAVYSVKGEEFSAPNYGRSLVSFDYEKKRNTRSAGRRRNRSTYSRNTYHAGSKVNILVDGDEPKNYQFDLYKDVLLQLGLYLVAFIVSAVLTWKFGRILFSKEEEVAAELAADATE